MHIFYGCVQMSPASIGIGYSYYEDIMQVVSKGGFDVRGSNYGSYLQAPSLFAWPFKPSIPF